MRMMLFNRLHYPYYNPYILANNMNTMHLFLAIISTIGILWNPDAEKKSIDTPPASKNECNTLDSILDNRDGRWYKLILVDSLFWFNENLSFNSPNSQVITLGDNARSIITRVYSYEDSRVVCPRGWRLPTVSEFDNLIGTVFDSTYTGFATLPYNWKTINSNPGGLRFHQSGFLHRKKVKSRENFNLWLDDTDIRTAYHVHMYDTNRKDDNENLTVFRHTHERHKPKENRKFPVRCVCEVSNQQRL